MACRFEVTLAAADGAFVPAAIRALDEVDRLEGELSVFIPTSAISEINSHAACGPVVVPSDLAELLTDCQRVHRDTDGAFDLTTTPLSRCWGFLRREARVPPREAIEDARRQVGLRRDAREPRAGVGDLQPSRNRVEPRRRRQGLRAGSRERGAARVRRVARAALGRRQQHRRAGWARRRLARGRRLAVAFPGGSSRRSCCGTPRSERAARANSSSSRTDDGTVT